MRKTYLFMQMAMLVSAFSVNCKLYGGCQLALPDKSLYKGECENGIPNGKGIKFFVENGTCLKGNFVNNVLDGECEIDFNDGGYFKGECKTENQMDLASVFIQMLVFLQVILEVKYLKVI